MNWSYKTKLWLPILTFLAICLTFSNSLAGKKYAAPNGLDTANGLSESTPLSLGKAFSSSSPLAPGDTLFLLDGIYEGNFVLEKSGTADKPIFILPKNEGKAIIDTGKNRTSGTGIIVNASNVWLIGIRVTSSSVVKREDLGQLVPYESGIAVFGPGVKLINCWVYDIPGGGLELWRPALNLEVYGCVIFNNGSQSSVRGTGHGMYIQHDEPDFPKIIRNNIVFQNASQGINIYTTNPPNGGVLVFENTSFNTGAIANFNGLFFRPPHNFSIGSENNLSFSIKAYDNVFYSDQQNGRLSQDQVSNVTLGRSYQPNQDFQFYNNTLYGGHYQVEIQPLETFRFTDNTFFNVHGKFFQFITLPQSLPNTTWNSNSYYLLNSDNLGFTGLNFMDWKSNSGFDAGSTLTTSLPSSPKIWVRKNNYDSKKFYVTILNPGGLDNVAVDFSSYSIPVGSTYELIDFQNPFEEESKVNGTYQNGSISFPMNRTKSLAPKGNMPQAPVHTESTLGTFQIKFSSPLAPPALKDTAKVYLNTEGRGLITPEIVLKDSPNSDFSFSYSLGPEVNCQQLGIRDLIVTTTLIENATVTKDTILLHVLDTIAPTFDAANAVFAFDPTIGKVNYGIADFDPVDVSDNCSTFLNMSLDGPEINCALLAENQGSYPRWPVTITVSDQSGNKRVKQVFVEIGNIIESKKVSLSAIGPLIQGNSVELRLGEELDFDVLEWRKDLTLLTGEKGTSILVTEPGRYTAVLQLKNGCTVTSKVLELVYSEFPFPPVKQEVVKELNSDGKAVLEVANLFEIWPLPNTSLTFEMSKSQFTCSDLGINEVTLLIKNSTGQSWERKVSVLVKDTIKPTVVPKNIELELDVKIGKVEITPEMLLVSVTDNCSLKSVTISKTSFTCEDAGKEFNVAIRAEDQSGNVTEAVSKVTIKRKEAAPIQISGNLVICAGEKTVLTLSSEANFEVVRWRRNGQEITGHTGKTLEVAEPGNYHAVIRYAGACLAESAVAEVKVNPKPTGEIRVDGNVLLAPEGDFTYQWFRNGEKLTGETNRKLTVFQIGEYSVELTNPNGCTARLQSVNLTISGLENWVKDPLNLKIYPNPAHDIATLEFPIGDFQLVDFHIQIIDSYGKEVTSSVQVHRVDGNKLELGLNRLAKGTYLIWLVGPEQKSYFGKLVLQ